MPLSCSFVILIRFSRNHNIHLNSLFCNSEELLLAAWMWLLLGCMFKCCCWLCYWDPCSLMLLLLCCRTGYTESTSYHFRTGRPRPSQSEVWIFRLTWINPSSTRRQTGRSFDCIASHFSSGPERTGKTINVSDSCGEGDRFHLQLLPFLYRETAGPSARLTAHSVSCAGFFFYPASSTEQNGVPVVK